MDELIALFPVLFLIYVFQCVAASPSGSTVFLLHYSLRGRVLRSFWRVGAQDRGLYLLNPFSCFSQAILVAGHPFSFVTNSSGEIAGINFPRTTENSLVNLQLTFKDPHCFVARSKLLADGDSSLAVLPSEHSARRLAYFLNQLDAAPPAIRTSLVDRELRRMLSSATILRRLQLYARRTSSLTTLCFFLFLYIFVVAPAAIFSFRLNRAWPVLVATLVLTALAIVWNFRQAHRALYPLEADDSLQHLIAIALSPLAAIRAADALAAPLLEEFHPVAVGSVVLAPDDFRRFAEMELRKVRFLHRDLVLEKHLTDFLRSHKLDSEALLAPPRPDSPDSRSFCPVCLTQYIITEGTCHECGDISLQSLSARAPHL